MVNEPSVYQPLKFYSICEKLFSSPVQMYRKSCCTTPGVRVSGGSISEMLKFLCDGQGTDRRVIYPVLCIIFGLR